MKDIFKSLSFKMSNHQESVGLVLRFALSVALSYITWRALKEVIEPNRKERLEAEKRTKKLLERLGLSSTVKLSEHEVFVATNLVEPSTMPISWSDIGGLDDTISEIRRTVLLPLRRQKNTRVSSLVQPPKGVLLYGPPGCGKTMLAKALAKEADARFINLQLSTLTDKWYGESQKLAAAVFSLAEKIQPVIIFIDEIDAFLRVRDRGDHEVTAMMKAQFLSLWDGLISDNSSRIVVLGATNRPMDVDDAIRRRLPCTFCITFPVTADLLSNSHQYVRRYLYSLFQNAAQRRLILQKILSKEELDTDVDLDMLAQQTEGCSGADLQELCRKAAVRCYHRNCLDQESQDVVKMFETTGGESRENAADEMAAISFEDFQAALPRTPLAKSTISTSLLQSNQD